MEEAGGDKSLLRKAPTKLGAATFVSRFHQKKADLLSARFAEKQAERRKKELKAAVLALREPEVNVKVKELEIALAEAGGVDSEAGDVDSEVGDGEVVDLEKEGDKSPGSVVPTTPVKKQPGSPQPHTPESVQVSAPSSAPEVPAVETAQVEIKGRPGRPMVQLRPAEVKVKAMPVNPQRVAGAPALPRSRSRPMPVILKEFRVPPPPPVLPPPPANFVGVYQLGGPGHGSRPPLFGPPVTGRTQVSASEKNAGNSGQLEQSRLPSILRSLWGLRPRRREASGHLRVHRKRPCPPNGPDRPPSRRPSTVCTTTCMPFAEKER